MLPTSSRSTSDLPRLRARAGFAMAVALGAIVVIGLLIVGVQFTTNQQTSAGRSMTSQEQAFRVAEAGLVQSLSNWSAGAIRDSLTYAGDSTLVLTKAALTLPAGLTVNSANVRVTRLNDMLYQVKSRADVGTGKRGNAVRSVSQLVRMLTTNMNFMGALTVQGVTKIGGSSLINGVDQNPTGWGCGTTDPTLAGIAIGDASQITYSGCNNGSCIVGDPKVLSTPLANDPQTYFDYGDTDWAMLVSMATLTMTTNPSPAPAYNADGSCNRTLQSNWGDVNRLMPAGKCENYFPIIYFPGSAKLVGGTGQGIMLVTGDLEVQGGFKFYGPVIVRGRLRTEGTGGHFNGAVMAANVDLAENSVLGNAVVNYSSCAVEQALKNIPAPPVPVRHRSWTESF